MTTRLKPTPKAKGIEDFLTDMAGESRQQAMYEGRCIKPPIGCGRPVLAEIDPSRVDEGAFRSELDMKEYTISGLCQRCWDEIERQAGEEDERHGR